MRLDSLLVFKKLAPSRERAKELIKNGQVTLSGKTVEKPSFDVPEDAEVTVNGEGLKYVSRGGLKMEKAVADFGIPLSGRICMDVGASTGGFTDCMLQNGAAKVYAVDAGTDQLSEKLKNDPRVISLEQTNIRYLTPEDLPEQPSFVSVDVSFISLKKVLPVVFSLLPEKGECVALIKPQFEAGREHLNKKGVVKSEKVREKVVKDITAFSSETGFLPRGVITSPITGPEGNAEYLIRLLKP